MGTCFLITFSPKGSQKKKKKIKRKRKKKKDAKVDRSRREKRGKIPSTASSSAKAPVCYRIYEFKRTNVCQKTAKKRWRKKKGKKEEKKRRKKKRKMREGKWVKKGKSWRNVQKTS